MDLKLIGSVNHENDDSDDKDDDDAEIKIKMNQIWRKGFYLCNLKDVAGYRKQYI